MANGNKKRKRKSKKKGTKEKVRKMNVARLAETQEEPEVCESDSSDDNVPLGRLVNDDILPDNMPLSRIMKRNPGGHVLNHSRQNHSIETDSDFSDDTNVFIANIGEQECELELATTYPVSTTAVSATADAMPLSCTDCDLASNVHFSGIDSDFSDDMNELIGNINEQDREFNTGTNNNDNMRSDNVTTQVNTRRFVQNLSVGELETLLGDEKEYPGLRHQYRIRRELPIVYHQGILEDDLVQSSDEGSEQNALVDQDVMELLQRTTLKCPDCNNSMTAKIVGTHLARRFIVKCINRHCFNNKPPLPKYLKKAKLWVPNIVGTLFAMQMDMGIQGVNNICWATHMKPFSVNMYQNHCKHIFQVSNSFRNSNMPLIHKDIIELYKRLDIGHVNVDTGKLDITISTDGVYSHVKEARQCTNYIADPLTGSMIDVVTLEKCFECKEHKLIGTNCKNRLYHGDSGGLERENIIKLFSDSQKLGFRYTGYISDGDAKVVKTLKDLKPYGEGVPIVKTECGNHMTNRVRGGIEKWGNNWDWEVYDARDLKRKKKFDAKEKADRKKREKEDKARKKAEADRKKEELRARRVAERKEKANKGKKGRGKVKGGGKSPVGEFLFPSKGSTLDVAVEESSLSLEGSQKTTLESFDPPQEIQESLHPPPECDLVDQETGLPENTEGEDEQSQAVSRTVPRKEVSGTKDGSSMDVQLDVPVSSNSQQDDPDDPDDDLDDLASRPLEEIDEPPIGRLPNKGHLLPPSVRDSYPASKKPIKHLFTKARVRAIGSKYRMAVYTHHTLQAQKDAVRSVPLHELDYQESSLDQKKEYHALCDKGKDSGCQFQAWCADGKDPAQFRRITTKVIGTNKTKPWTRGLYAGLDYLFPEAWAELQYRFKALSSDEVLSRCSRLRTTNVNESIHQKVGLFVKKCKSHTTERIQFGTRSLQMSQNIGYRKSSLLNVYGWLNDDISKGLKFKDDRSFRSAARKHKLEEGTTHQHRKKVSKLVLSGDVARNRDGTGAREDGATGSGMDVGGANESRINVGASGSGLNIGASGSGLNVGARCTRSRNRSSRVYESGMGD